MPTSNSLEASSLPLCSICCDTLGTCGGPATLPCGHNGCKDCLVGLQQRPPTLCPLCRTPFDPRLTLAPNTELRDLINLATSVLMDEQERELGWEAFPDRARTAEEYAAELKLGRQRSEGHAPSAPPAPHVPGSEIAATHQQVMDLTPLPWLPDSWASHCGACRKPFRALTRLRHHCRCCGKIYCGACSPHRALLPPRFNCCTPQRVCDNCAAMLAPLQTYLAATMAAAARPPVHDAVLDAVSLRAWLNMPYCSSLEQDVYKAANVLAKFTQTARLQPEAAIPSTVLAGACGLVVMSLAKVGAGWSATFGTGVVVSRSSTGQWSAPCAVAAAGLGWGLQLGGELTDLLLVLRTPDAVRACTGAVQLGLGGSAGVAIGPLGRSADASMLVGSSALMRPGAAYAYSCSQGAFIGVSLEGSLLSVRDSVNHAFYGLPVTAKALLLERSVAPPPAAAALYDALHTLMRKYEVNRITYSGPSIPPARSATPTLLATNSMPSMRNNETNYLLEHNPAAHNRRSETNAHPSNVLIEELSDEEYGSRGQSGDVNNGWQSAARQIGGQIGGLLGGFIAGAQDAGYGMAAAIGSAGSNTANNGQNGNHSQQGGPAWMAAPSAPAASAPSAPSAPRINAAATPDDDGMMFNLFDD